TGVSSIINENCIDNSMLLQVLHIGAIGQNIDGLSCIVFIDQDSVPVFKLFIIRRDSNPKKHMIGNNNKFGVQSYTLDRRRQQDSEFDTHSASQLQHICW